MSQSNNKPLIAAAVFGIPGLLIALTSPFKTYGDSITPGLGDLMNGGIALTLIILAAVAAIVVRKRTGS
jgi:hypothetical protein